jgi:hypothetical protein
MRAFSRQGELAFVSRERLWVLDGSRALRPLPLPASNTASSPSFSHDGRWLAYLVSRGPAVGALKFGLWLARANGTDAHAVGGVAVDELVGWSPTADVLAVTALAPVHLRFGWSSMPTRLDLVGKSGIARRLVTVPAAEAALGDSIEAAVWSPGGRAIAVSTYGPAQTSGTVIRAVPLTDPQHAITWFSIRNSQRLGGICSSGCVPDAVIADLKGWLPREGVAFWIFSSGAIHNPDSTPLVVVSRPGARPRVVAHTLSDGITRAAAAGSNGELAVVASSQDSGRWLAQGKLVETCEPRTLVCAPLPEASVWSGPGIQRCPCAPAPRPGEPGSGVSLDPAWSPDGEQLAYVKAPVDLASAWPSTGWYREHVLYLWNRTSGATRRIGPVDGAQLPTWSRNGSELLYVADDGLWLTHVHGGNPIEIEHPLFREREWNDVAATSDIAFYGQIPWTAQFSWSSP